MTKLEAKRVEMMFRVFRVLKYFSRDFGLDDFKTFVSDFNPAMIQMEDGTEYRYPATFEVKIENRNTHKLSYRISDGRWIYEGCKLEGTGLSSFRLVREMVREMKQWNNMLHPKATNVVAIRRK